MRLRPSFAAIATSVLVAACGGSPHGSSTSASATAAASAHSPSATQTTSTPSAATTSTEDTTTTTSTASAPPEVPRTKTHRHPGEGGSHGGVSQGAHVETNVAVNANGDISPPVVSVPSGVGVEIRVTNHGSAADTVALSIPAHPSVHVAAGATATLQTAGLKDGTYRILVNGTPRGQLMIGAQGGP